MGTGLGRGSSHCPRKGPQRAFQFPRLTGPRRDMDPIPSPSFPPGKLKGLKEPVFLLLWALVS